MVCSPGPRQSDMCGVGQLAAWPASVTVRLLSQSLEKKLLCSPLVLSVSEAVTGNLHIELEGEVVQNLQKPLPGLSMEAPQHIGSLALQHL